MHDSPNERYLKREIWCHENKSEFIFLSWKKERKNNKKPITKYTITHSFKKIFIIFFISLFKTITYFELSNYNQ